VYPASILPDELRPWLKLNPMVPLITAYQDVLVHGRWPDWSSLLVPAALAIALCLLGMRLFRKRVGEIVDEL
jgi:lipopolysaccharide transport system permease protein